MTVHKTENSAGAQRQLSIQFLGEQDGETERQLKLALARQFQKIGNIDRAYLVRVRYSGTVASVALAIAAGGDARKAIVESVQEVFSAQFATDQHLDVMFPSAADEVALSSVCKPFFNVSV